MEQIKIQNIKIYDLPTNQNSNKQWRSTPVAIKVLKANKMEEKELIDFIAEINLMKSLRPHGINLNIFIFIS